jgi:NAD-dependent SIR2 family protein deacetylase
VPNALSTAEVGRPQLDALVDLLSGRTWTVLSGAGASTDSGIPDYRGPTSARATPMLFGEFVGSPEAQQRYWARSYLGWRRMVRAQPNAGHRALVGLERFGLFGVVTQNVDGLHGAAGSRDVVSLHGEIATVICLDCGERTPRRNLQERLALLNPGFGDLEPGRTQVRPDGDAVVRDWQDFNLAPCLLCGGRLKPDVVFFGESVPKARVVEAYAMVDATDLLVVVGSSLTVMSGLRFVRHQANRRRRPVVIINRGRTRGDDLATLKLDAGCSETLTALQSGLAARGLRPPGRSATG